MQDLLNEQGALANNKYLQEKYNLNIKFLEYESLMAAIPKNWKAILNKSNNNLGCYIFYDCKIHINKQQKSLEEITTK
jgi:hypothetical protein